MKTILSLLFFIFIFSNSDAQERVYIDENGKEINKSEYRRKWLDEKYSLSSWHYIGEDDKRYLTLKKDLYLKDVFNYHDIKKQLEKIIKRQIPDNIIIALEYYYKDDLCNSTRDNKWTKGEISERKNFLRPIRKELKNKNIVFIALFEEGMILKNKPDNKNEYFYIDVGGFFRGKIFINPTLCGSEAIIKPNGQTLIRNGEFRPDMMAMYLKPEIWEGIFEIED